MQFIRIQNDENDDTINTNTNINTFRTNIKKKIIIQQINNRVFTYCTINLFWQITIFLFYYNT